MTHRPSMPQTALIEDAVEEAIEAAGAYVSSLPKGQNAWGMKEYKIAETAAREAIAALRQMEAGK
jgi:hypothetical protein